MLFDTVYHEPLCYHSVGRLPAFFRRHGMELIEVERIPPRGSLRGTAQAPAGRAASPPSAGAGAGPPVRSAPGRRVGPPTPRIDAAKRQVRGVGPTQGPRQIPPATGPRPR